MTCRTVTFSTSLERDSRGRWNATVTEHYDPPIDGCHESGLTLMGVRTKAVARWWMWRHERRRRNRWLHGDQP